MEQTGKEFCWEQESLSGPFKETGGPYLVQRPPVLVGVPKTLRALQQTKKKRKKNSQEKAKYKTPKILSLPFDISQLEKSISCKQQASVFWSPFTIELSSFQQKSIYSLNIRYQTDIF